MQLRHLASILFNSLLWFDRCSAFASTMPTVFNYGSNSTCQLRLRLRNANLVTEAAYLPGFSRVFVLQSPTWNNGGVASLAPSRNPCDKVYGSIVELTDAELKLLDKFESVYRQEELSEVVVGDRRMRGVIAYVAVAGAAVCGGVAGDQAATRNVWTPSMTVEPSEMYLNAVRLSLREHWPQSEYDRLEIRSFENGVPRLVREWRYPGVDALGMEAVLVAVNTYKQEPWVDGGIERKRNMLDVADKLRKVGVCNGRDLRETVSRRMPFKSSFEEKGIANHLSQDTVNAMRAVFR